jgi:hypothetical protein
MSVHFYPVGVLGRLTLIQGNEFWCDDTKKTEFKHAALHDAQRDDEAVESFLSKVDQAPDMQIRGESRITLPST